MRLKARVDRPAHICEERQYPDIRVGAAQVQLQPQWGAEVACVWKNEAANCRKWGSYV